MLRPDERTAWKKFLVASPLFASEGVANWSDGPDPPDVVSMSASGKTIGVELTKWVEHAQVTEGKGRERLERSYDEIVRSEGEPRPAHIGFVYLHDKSLRIRQEDEVEFRTQLFKLLAAENAKPEPLLPRRSLPIPVGYWSTVRYWNMPSGAPIKDFAVYPMLEKYLTDLWIFPRERLPQISGNNPWVWFEAPGGAYTTDWMVQAAVDRIKAKIRKHEHDNIRSKHLLDEFDLLCFYCDEAAMHNSPIHTAGFGFRELAAKVDQALTDEPRVFDRIFLFHPYEDPQVVQIYSGNS
jgi:hypothetical protein